jgi:hypothetical protein
MRKMATVAVAALSVGLAFVGPKAEAQQATKMLRVVGTDAAGVHVDVTRPIGGVSITVSATGTSIDITGALARCGMTVATAADAAALQARILDPKTTGVECTGTATTTRTAFGESLWVRSATAMSISANP